jgi:hypothetical protein
VFVEAGNFYFNAIDCEPGNPDACCACGEADDGPTPGARIHCTFDGGKTWNRTFFQARRGGTSRGKGREGRSVEECQSRCQWVPFRSAARGLRLSVVTARPAPSCDRHGWFTVDTYPRVLAL